MRMHLDDFICRGNWRWTDDLLAVNHVIGLACHMTWVDFYHRHGGGSWEYVAVFSSRMVSR